MSKWNQPLFRLSTSFACSNTFQLHIPDGATPVNQSLCLELFRLTPISPFAKDYLLKVLSIHLAKTRFHSRPISIWMGYKLDFHSLMKSEHGVNRVKNPVEFCCRSSPTTRPLSLQHKHILRRAVSIDTDEVREPSLPSPPLTLQLNSLCGSLAKWAPFMFHFLSCLHRSVSPFPL